MMLSKNFSLEELTRSDIAARKGLDNTPNEAEIANLKRLAAFLEEVRATLITPILINSGYRSKAVNDAVGSHDGSQHRLGCAADIRVTNRTPEGLMLAIYESKLQYDQLLLEFADGKGGGWVHISIPNVAGGKPRKQALKIGRGGTFVYP